MAKGIVDPSLWGLGAKLLSVHAAAAAPTAAAAAATAAAAAGDPAAAATTIEAASPETTTAAAAGEPTAAAAAAAGAAAAPPHPPPSPASSPSSSSPAAPAAAAPAQAAAAPAAAAPAAAAAAAATSSVLYGDFCSELVRDFQQLGLSASGPYRKSARVVGEVLGKFHPHGDKAVYDALVRLAQPFVSHLPLIEGHGNFGCVDGDPAAAMRYTECRLSSFCQDVLLKDLHTSACKFRANFDATEVEPECLPARLPLLLLQGAAGVAVGVATNLPPHNLTEVADATIALIEYGLGRG
ncbi:DNA gyrase subunit A, putative [Eimeria mitis]|uniref:DNA gyrase subunit A, putative n=1 Tax=Eimeria mitis TaxID=44415 RepID=U6JVL1_9EIME|nr:DNA gyrase subunit A, putative [Eimeria mitis]CDJ28811.1 DNA gyrase subunit A, putative [Eimeria mitis]